MKELKKEELEGERIRRYHLVLNNYDKHGDTRDMIINRCSMTNPIYFCLGMEVSDTGTPHCHIYLDYKHGRSFNRMKKLFPYAHIEVAKGTAYDNYLYIRKEGKHADKSCTLVPDTFYEEGDKDVLKQPLSSTLNKNQLIIKGIEKGMSVYDIACKYGYSIKSCEEIKSAYIYNKYFNKKKDNLINIYVSGVAQAGKTTYFQEEYPDGFRTVDFKHGFDMYNYQDAVCFDEYHSDISIAHLLDYMNEYVPQLRCRYNNKLGVYHTFVITSNANIEEQYTDIQNSSPETYCAFLRRFSKIVIYTGFLEYEEYTLGEYLEKYRHKFNKKVFQTKWMENYYPSLYIRKV